MATATAVAPLSSPQQGQLSPPGRLSSFTGAEQSERQRWLFSAFRVLPAHTRACISELARCTVLIDQHMFSNVSWYSAPLGVVVLEFSENKGTLWCALPLEFEFSRVPGGDDLQGRYTPLPKGFSEPPFQDPAAADELAKLPHRVIIAHAPLKLQQYLRVADANVNVIAPTPPRMRVASAEVPVVVSSGLQQLQRGPRQWGSDCFTIEAGQLCAQSPRTPPAALPSPALLALGSHLQPAAMPLNSPCLTATRTVPQPQMQQRSGAVWQSPAFQQHLEPSPTLVPTTPTTPAATFALVQQSPASLSGVAACPLPSMQLPPLMSLASQSPVVRPQPQQPLKMPLQMQLQGMSPALASAPVAPQLARNLLPPTRDGMSTLAEAARSIDRSLFSPAIAGDTAPPTLAQQPGSRPHSSTPFAAVSDDEAVSRLLGVAEQRGPFSSYDQSSAIRTAPAASPIAAPCPPPAPVPQQQQPAPLVSSSPRRAAASSKITLSSDESEFGDDDCSDDTADDGGEYSPYGSRSSGSRKRQRVAPRRQTIDTAPSQVQLGNHSPKQGDTALAPVCMWKGCGRVFERVSQLTAHLQTHTMSQSVHRCQWEGCCRAGKPFGNHSGLFRHLRYHTGDKPCKCTYGSCTFSSVDNGELRRHLKLVHRVEMSDLPQQPAMQEPSPPQPQPMQSPSQQRLSLSTGSAAERLAAPHAFVPMLSLASPQLRPSQPLNPLSVAPPS